MTPDDAVKRLMAEIIGFTDRPDYSMPPTVRDAFKIVEAEMGISDTYMYEHYMDWQDEDEEREGEDDED